MSLTVDKLSQTSTGAVWTDEQAARELTMLKVSSDKAVMIDVSDAGDQINVDDSSTSDWLTDQVNAGASVQKILWSLDM